MQPCYHSSAGCGTGGDLVAGESEWCRALGEPDCQRCALAIRINKWEFDASNDVSRT
jgi:hypothetical protein